MPSRLAQHLVSRALLSQEQAGELLRQHQAQGGHLDTALLERGIPEADVLAMLGEVSGFRPVNLVDFEPNLEVASFIPPKIAERLSVVPLSLDGNTLHVACAYPVPKKELDEVGFLLGRPLELWVAIELRVREWIAIIYRQPLPPRFVQLADALAQQAGALTPPPPPPPDDESMTVDMVEQLARNVAQEPVPAQARPTASREPEPADIPPPAYVREPLRLNTSAGPVTTARAVQRPTPPPTPTDIPPPAYTREPLRLNMPGTPARAAPPAQAPNRGAPGNAAPPTLYPPGERPPPPPQPVPVLLPVGPAGTPATQGSAQGGRPAAPGAFATPPQTASRPATTVQQGPATQGFGGPGTAQGISATQGFGGPGTPVQQGGTTPAAQPAQVPARPGTTVQGAQGTSPAAPPSANRAVAPAQPPGARPAVWPPAPEQQARAAQPSATPTQPPVPPAPPRSEPSFIIFSNPGSTQGPNRPRAAEPASVPGASSAPDAAVPEWTLPQARSALRESTRDLDRLLDVALRFGRRTFDYVAAFAVVRGAAGGWDSRGDGWDANALAQVSIPLDASSVFRTVAVTRGSYAGPLPPDALTRHYLELFGRQAPRTVFLYPVEVKGRLVAILYGDCGQKPMSQRRLSDYILFCQDLPAAFQELILFRKQRVSELRAPEEDITIDVDVPGFPAPVQPAPAPAVVAGLGWNPVFGRGGVANLGRAAALPPRVLSPEELPPPDFTPLLRRLTGPDASQRSSAIAELARSPEASARVLAQHFPGPTAWSRLPVVELPEADELGPIPAALSRLGRPAAVALAPLLDSNDADTRYLALLTAGNLPYAELVDGVLRGLFDMEPDISSAARVAAAALKHLPRLDASLRDLRQELASRDALRRSLAARALGTLHDRDAIEGLINLTGSDDAMCAQAAAEALREVTRATLGLQPRQWSAWWAENRSRRRADWLVAALRHRELDVRLAAIEELSRALHDTLGYYADAPDAEREAAVRRWESAAVDPANARRLGML
ncbi:MULTISPECIES: FrgA protein [unclassified Corallococcus]|uniref:GspE/PulE/PilB domain-containing protein n=1 Tax=unclassified Corallococcus TaxID=2685029 RepID=UPI001A8D21BD|nr:MULTISPECIES: FrgA protein [unclassified Corallococcus]MBN9688116.1 FrgA protein [Corallococcus sp. NCSPR001]WAS88075.1 FrgA protein [Corallococcus sp. NCRR]